MRELINILGEIILLILFVFFAIFSAIIVVGFIYGILKAIIDIISRAFKDTNNSSSSLSNRNNDRS